MCGIAGYFGKRVLSPAQSSTDDGGAAPARPGCRARALLVERAAADDRGGAQRAAAHAAVDHRSAARSRPADGERCGRRLDFVQRGSLRLGRRCRNVQGGGLCLSHAFRYRIHPARLRALGHRFRLAAPRHVRDRDSRSAPTRRLRHSRPARPQACRLCASATTASLSRRPRARCCRGCREKRERFPPKASTRISRIGPFRRRARFSTTSAGSRLRIGSATTSRRGTLEAREYWRPEPSAEAWLPTLDAAIRMRTVADRPLGLFLSSGVDSSAIACRLAAMGFNRLQSFTAAFPDTPFDESALARAAADRLGFPNLAVTIPSRIADDFARLVADLDEPFADPSSVPTWYLARETTRHVKVVLGGDGGDELFGGYKRYAKHLRTRWRRGIVLPGMRAPAGIGGSGWQRCGEELRLDWRAAYALRFSGFTPGERAFFAPEAAPPAHYWRMPDSAATDAPRAARDRPAQLPSRLHSAQGRSLHDGARPRDARAIARSSLRRRRGGASGRRAVHDAATEAPGAGNDGARRSRSVRAQEARLQSAARRLARERSGATNSGNGRRASRSCRAACSMLRESTVRRYLEEREDLASPSRCCSSSCSTNR